MEKALQHDKLLQQTHTMMRYYLQETSERMQHQIDKKLKIAPQLKKGDVKAQAGTAEPTEASVQRYTEQCSPDPVDEVDDV